MKRYLLVLALLLTTLTTGCFTTFGAIAGSAKKTPSGNDDPYAVGRGVLIGAAIDVALIVLILSTADFHVGLPSEPD